MTSKRFLGRMGVGLVSARDFWAHSVSELLDPVLIFIWLLRAHDGQVLLEWQLRWQWG